MRKSKKTCIVWRLENKNNFYPKYVGLILDRMLTSGEVFGQNMVFHLTMKQAGFDLLRQNRVTLNRLRTVYKKCNKCINGNCILPLYIFVNMNKKKPLM